MDQQIREWNELDHNQRNSLMWPDFLKWQEQSRNVEITRTDPNGSLGLVSIDVQDQETKEWYHVTKRIKENSPAVAHVYPYEWICKVDDKLTTNCPRDEFINLINNRENDVHLSLKKAHDALRKFVKQWGEKKTVTLNLKEENNFKNEFRLAHFYSKDNSGNEQDRILVWEVKPDSAKTNKPLYRGDELLEVNGKHVKGKKLAEIYELIFDEANAEVKMTFKEIQRNYEVENHPNAMTPETETPCQHPDEENTSLEPDSPTQCIVVTQEMDQNAGKKDIEIYENPVVCNESEGDISPAACTEEPKKPVTETMTKKLKRFSFKRSSSKDSPSSPEQIKEQNALGKNESDNINIGYSTTPPPSRKPSMCNPCVMKKESDSELSENRDTWPINMIDPGTFEEICTLIDLEDRNTIPLFKALDCFNQTEVAKMRSECKPTGGLGIAKKALNKWGTNCRENNVSAFKVIVEKSLQRNDVLKKIRAWEKMSVCHSCGRKK